MPLRRRRPLALPLLCLLLLPLLTACPATPGPGAEACTGPSLGAASAPPAGELVVHGVPQGFAELGARALDSSGAAVPVAIERRDDGRVVLTVPLHPSGSPEGGSVTLDIDSPQGACPALDLAIEPLPPASARVASVARDAEERLGGVLVDLGVAGDVDPRNLPDGLRPLAALQHALSGADNPNSLQRQLDGTAPLLEGQTLDFALLDALLAAQGADGALQTLIDLTVDALTPPAELAALASAQDLSLQGTTGPFEICHLTVEGLDACMKWQRKLDERLESAEFKAASAAINRILLVLATSPTPPNLKLTSNLLASTMYLTFTALDGVKSMLPSQLDGVHFKVSRTQLYLDDAGRNGGSWSEVRLSAMSKGWTVKLPHIIDGVLTVFGGLDYLKVLDKIGVRDGLAKDAIPHILNWIVVGMDIADAKGCPLCYQAAPERFGPFDVGDSTVYTTVTLEPQGLLSVDRRTRSYRGLKAGRVDLVMQMRAPLFEGVNTRGVMPMVVNGGACPLAEGVSTQGAGCVTLSLSPESVTLAPGARTSFTAVVDGSPDRGVSWTASGGSIAGSGEQVTYTAPMEPGSYTVTVVSTSDPSASATAAVEVQESRVCTGAFTATDLGRTATLPKLNDRGEVLMRLPYDEAAEYEHGASVLWRDGVRTLVPGLFALDLGDTGAVVGDVYDASGSYPAIYRDGTFTPLPYHPLAISSSDLLLVQGDATPTMVAGIWSDGVVQKLAGRAHWDGVEAADLNASGVVVGRAYYDEQNHILRWRDGTVEDLGIGIGHLVNDVGDIFVRLYGSNWSGVGSMALLGRAGEVSHYPMDFEAYAMNDEPVVVGHLVDAGCSPQACSISAVMGQNGRLTNLNSITSLPDGVKLTKATDINASCQITAVQDGVGLDYLNSYRAFLLTPVDP